jgi:hypothetical protein
VLLFYSLPAIYKSYIADTKNHEDITQTDSTESTRTTYQDPLTTQTEVGYARPENKEKYDDLFKDMEKTFCRTNVFPSELKDFNINNPIPDILINRLFENMGAPKEIVDKIDDSKKLNCVDVKEGNIKSMTVYTTRSDPDYCDRILSNMRIITQPEFPRAKYICMFLDEEKYWGGVNGSLDRTVELINNLKTLSKKGYYAGYLSAKENYKARLIRPYSDKIIEGSFQSDGTFKVLK